MLETRMISTYHQSTTARKLPRTWRGNTNPNNMPPNEATAVNKYARRCVLTSSHARATRPAGACCTEAVSDDMFSNPKGGMLSRYRRNNRQPFELKKKTVLRRIETQKVLTEIKTIPSSKSDDIVAPAHCLYNSEQTNSTEWNNPYKR